jgi:two-component system chemotaxis response regulator CheB
MPGRDIIVVGASAGGVEALSHLVAGLPAGLPAAMFIVLHIPAGAPSMLADILCQDGPLPGAQAEDGEAIQTGQIYVAPPDFHMLLRPGHIELTRGPRENHVRPAIDPLFRSAARAYGDRVIGVVLTGHLYDGTAGLMAIRGAGGVAVVQDPADALVDTMPRTARDIAGADYVLPLAQISTTLIDLVHRSPPKEGDTPVADPEENAQKVVQRAKAEQEAGGKRGDVSVLTCPECGGTLFQLENAKLIQFSCHVGHSYYAEALLAEQNEALEAALWTAVRMFKEKGVLARQLAAQARAKGDGVPAERYEDQAALTDQYADSIQQFILKGVSNPTSGMPILFDGKSPPGKRGA